MARGIRTNVVKRSASIDRGGLEPAADNFDVDTPIAGGRDDIKLGAPQFRGQDIERLLAAAEPALLLCGQI
jgi:hypothetical protein